MLAGAIGSMPGSNGIVTDAKAQLRPDAVRKIIKYGPFTLPGNKGEAKMDGGHAHGSGGMGMSGAPAAPPKTGHEGMNMGGAPPAKPKGGADPLAALGSGKPMDPNGVGLVKRLSTGICKDCTVLAGRTRVVYANGTLAELVRLPLDCYHCSDHC
jgi:hypothetical protein